MKEIWKDIKGYEGIYQISTMGRVKSLRRNIILKNQIASNGYEMVKLYTNNSKKDYSIHRLVANAFIENPDNLPQVNHRDENKTNNCVENLEWCTPKYNYNYGTINIRKSQKQLNDKNKSKVVLQYTKDGCFIKEWKSIRDIQRMTGYDKGYISKCCRGKYAYAYSYIWKYKKEME